MPTKTSLPLFALIVLAGATAQGASISGPAAGGRGEGDNSLTATDQTNPRGFDVSGTLFLLTLANAGYTQAFTTTSNLSLQIGNYQTQIAVAGTAYGDHNGESAELTVSTQLFLNGAAVANSYVQSSGFYRSSSYTTFSLQDQQPGSVISSAFFVPVSGTYTLTQVLSASVAPFSITTFPTASSSGTSSSSSASSFFEPASYTLLDSSSSSESSSSNSSSSSSSSSSMSGSFNGSNGISFDFTDPTSTITPAAAPEPASLALFASGLGFFLYRRNRKSKRVGRT